ncbi:MAG: acylneuraminate cytidylyltransferase family protein [bacterium]|nr:acylneuraminate cytidylyltransferase family protein [bacterium]
MNILGIIPARGGSKGIPKKNIKLLNGKPLIYYTIEAAKRSKLKRIIVSTEDPEIEEVSKRLGVEVIKRSASLSEDDTPTQPVLIDALDKIGEDFDAVMTLQATSPLRDFNHINEAIELFSINSEADSLVSVVKIPHNMTPVSIMKESEGFLYSYIDKGSEILRRQDKPIYYARNGAAIYITRISKIKDYIFGGKILPYFMNKLESVDIDDVDDWVLAELILKNRENV